VEVGRIQRREVLSIGLGALAIEALPITASAITALSSEELVQDPVQAGSDRSPGSLLICGGGKLPEELLDRFCEISDAKNSRLVLIPTASERSDTGDYSPWLELWKQRGWQEVRVVHAPDRQAALEEDFAKAIDESSAVWITGGDQSRLADRYRATVLVERLVRLLDRGGVLGGTSAGAAILSDRMIIGGVSDPMMGQGFGFLPRVIIDQHFSQKDRFERLSKSVVKHPEMVGIGIDESTGLELRGAMARVIGRGRVHGYRGGSDSVVWSANDTIESQKWPELFETGWLKAKK
jgi:cyanophycinase